MQMAYVKCWNMLSLLDDDDDNDDDDDDDNNNNNNNNLVLTVGAPISVEVQWGTS